MKEASQSVCCFSEQENRRLVCQSDSGKNNLADDLMVGAQRSELRPLKLGQHTFSTSKQLHVSSEMLAKALNGIPPGKTGTRHKLIQCLWPIPMYTKKKK